MLKKDNKKEQMVYYQTGIGTYTTGPAQASGFFDTISRRFSRISDLAIAWSLPLHIQAGYEFLMQNYEPGNKICIFGFSRGAYTARALAGMLTKVGLLPADNKEQIPFAYKMYRREDTVGVEQSQDFRNAFSIKVQVDFLGIWDCVKAVGLFPHTLPFTMENRGIRVYRHAVSLDERRAKFKANLTIDTGDEEEGLHIKRGPRDGLKWRRTLSEFGNNPEKVAAKLEAEETSYYRSFGKTDVLEVWFAGCHCDVGGGAVDNKVPHSLARIPLRWMVRQCFLNKTGIRFRADLLKKFGLDPEKLSVTPQPDPTTSSSSVEGEDQADVISPINDQLSLSIYWWLYELIPVKRQHQKKCGTLVWKARPNMGHGRYIPHSDGKKINVHRTVDSRIKAGIEGKLPGGRPYTPRARSWKHIVENDKKQIKWVD